MSSFAINNIIDGTANSIGDFGNSDIITTYGFIIGTFINIVWIGLGIYLIEEKSNIDWFKTDKWYTYAPSIALFLTAIGNMIFYYYSKQDKKDKDTYYANISLTPLYISIIIFLMLIPNR
jgi:hypothetical protein